MSGVNLRKSVLVCSQYLGEGQGGIAECARMSMTALAARDDVSALACMADSDFVVAGAPVRAFRGSRARFVSRIALSGPRYDLLLYDFAGTARAHRAIPFRRSSCAVWAHGYEVWGETRPEYLAALARADRVLVHSQHTRERAGAALGDPSRVRLCELATSPDEGSLPASTLDGPPTVLTLGRIDEMLAKGHDLLISVWPKVLSAVPDARLVFAGGGVMVEHVRSLAAASSACQQIDVLGFVAPERVDGLWSRASVFCMQGYAEGFGLVYVQAMRRGIPVIASLEDAGQEVNADGETGFNVSRGDPDRLVDVLVTLLRDRDLCRRLGAAGQKRWRERYTFDELPATPAAGNGRSGNVERRSSVVVVLVICSREPRNTIGRCSASAARISAVRKGRE